MNSLPEARSPIAIIIMSVVIQAGGLNIGYVITYLTLSINTLFANLYILNLFLEIFQNQKEPILYLFLMGYYL